MLIQTLMNKLSDEVQYSEGRQDCVAPDVNVNKANTVIVPDKFKKDIEALEDYTGRKLESGLCIKVDLSELLTSNTEGEEEDRCLQYTRSIPQGRIRDRLNHKL
jgi:hypothetical protein